MGFKSVKKKYTLSDNIKLIITHSYIQKLNSLEKICAYIRQFYKNKVFNNVENLKLWIHDFVKNKLELKLTELHEKVSFFCLALIC